MRITANQITLVRILALPFPAWALVARPEQPWMWIAFVVGTLVGATDFVDGWLARKQGPTKLGALLDPARYPPRWHELIVSMMQEPALGLCLPIAGGGSPHYLLPDALPVGEPDYGVWPAGALRFRFQYSLLPTGFIPRFIVEAHRSLSD